MRRIQVSQQPSMAHVCGVARASTCRVSGSAVADDDDEAEEFAAAAADGRRWRGILYIYF